MSKVKDETNHRYGKLLVIQRDGSDSAGKAKWLCKCDCGKIISVSGDALRSGRTKSCGCAAAERMQKVGKANAKDITGQTFNYLTAIRPVGSAPYGGVLWECSCRCGNKHVVEYSNLVGGKTKSCGCLASAGEAAIQELLTEHHIEFKTQFTPNGWKLSTNFSPYYDFALFKNKQLISLLEFNGEQHRKFYKNKHTWNNEENFLKTLRRDKEKEQLCKDNNIPLFIIWYDENIEQKLIQILQELKFETK